MDTNNRVLLIPGNWMGSEVLNKLNEQNPNIETVTLIGLTHKQRVKKIDQLLKSNRYNTIIAYSSGCSVLAECERFNLVHLSTKVVYCAPAPQTGVFFTTGDKMFRMVAKYLPKLLIHALLRKTFLLTKSDLMSLFEGVDDENTVCSLEAESALLLLGQILNQFKSSKKLNNNPNRTIVKSVGDKLLGSTQKKTVKILNGAETSTTTEGHFGPMIDLVLIINKITAM